MNEKTFENGNNHVGGTGLWKIIGGVTIALLAVGIITQLDDIRRYLRISMM